MLPLPCSFLLYHIPALLYARVRAWIPSSIYLRGRFADDPEFAHSDPCSKDLRFAGSRVDQSIHPEIQREPDRVAQTLAILETRQDFCRIEPLF